MITPEEKKELSGLKHTSFGRALVAYLTDEMNDLNDITTPKSWEETQGRQYAVKVIRKLFSFMEDKKPKGKGKNQYV